MTVNGRTENMKVGGIKGERVERVQSCKRREVGMKENKRVG